MLVLMSIPYFLMTGAFYCIFELNNSFSERLEISRDELKEIKQVTQTLARTQTDTLEAIDRILTQLRLLERTVKSLEVPKTDKKYTYPLVKHFNLGDYVDQDPQHILQQYADFHNKMTSGVLEPPRFLFVKGYGDSNGLGNSIQHIAFAFLHAMLSGRALLLSFEENYPITDDLFGPPGFDWTYWKHPLSIHQELIGLDPLRLPSCIEGNFDDDRPIVLFEKEKVSAAYKFQDVLDNEFAQKIIPMTLKNWKPEVVHWLFQNATAELRDPVEHMKADIRSKGFERIWSVQIRTGIPGTEADRDWTEFVDCVRYWSNNDTKTAFFIAADQMWLREMMKAALGDQAFLFSMESTKPKGPGGELGGGFEVRPNKVAAVVDWYMLGEGERMFQSAASTYGITAADRALIMDYPERFHLGGLTTCRNKDSPYYLERIYKSWMADYEETGKLKWHWMIQ